MKSPIRSTAQLARRLGVSRWTVSRALNDQPGVHARTAAKIKAAACRDGFAPSLLGRGLRSGRTDQVGICLPNLVDYFLTAKITLLQDALRHLDLHPFFQIIDGTVEAEDAALQRFAAMRCAAVMVIASRLGSQATGVRCLTGAGIPVVRIDPLNSGAGPSVSTDRKSAMQDALRHLHRLGHRHVTAAGFFPGVTYSEQRIEGLRAGCRAAGWNFRRNVRILPHPGGEDDFSAGVSLAAACHGAMKNCRAILAINDRVAMGLLQGFTACGFSVPHDITIIGYDNADFSAHTSPPLTTVDPRVDLLITQAVKMLDAKSHAKPGGRTRSFLIKPRLVQRSSDGPPSFTSSNNVIF